MGAVASAKNADALATAALALAVASLASQIAIAIYQSSVASGQAVQAERLTSETKILLRDIRATGRNLHDTLTSQFNLVLRHALHESIPEAVEEAAPGAPQVDKDRLEKTIGDKLADLVGRYIASLEATRLGPADVPPFMEEGGQTPE